MAEKKIGYIRVSSIDQNTDRQLDGMELDKVFEEKISGKDVKRPQLSLMLDFIREDDHVYVHELSRLGRSMKDLYDLVEKIIEKGARITFVKEGITFPHDENVNETQEAIQRAMFGMLSVFSQFERDLITPRLWDGMATATDNGKHLGSQFKPTDDKIA
jgi:DNA invertase Pin-like site-specific DNA recombinase